MACLWTVVWKTTRAKTDEKLSADRVQLLRQLSHLLSTATGGKAKGQRIGGTEATRKLWVFGSGWKKLLIYKPKNLELQSCYYIGRVIPAVLIKFNFFK